MTRGRRITDRLGAVVNWIGLSTGPLSAYPSCATPMTWRQFRTRGKERKRWDERYSTKAVMGHSVSALSSSLTSCWRRYIVLSFIILVDPQAGERIQDARTSCSNDPEDPLRDGLEDSWIGIIEADLSNHVGGLLNQENRIRWLLEGSPGTNGVFSAFFISILLIALI